MGRPKKEVYKIDEVYLVDALLLAGQYAGMKKEAAYLEQLLKGDYVYTEEMALAELSGGSFSDMERVQTSNISSPTERIAILLMDGFVEKRNAELQKEAARDLREYMELTEQIDIVEVAMQERMAEKERKIFYQIFVEMKSWSEIKDCFGNCMDKHQVSRERDKCILAIARELEVRKYLLGRE